MLIRIYNWRGRRRCDLNATVARKLDRFASNARCIHRSRSQHTITWTPTGLSRALSSTQAQANIAEGRGADCSRTPAGTAPPFPLGLKRAACGSLRATIGALGKPTDGELVQCRTGARVSATQSSARCICDARTAGNQSGKTEHERLSKRFISHLLNKSLSIADLISYDDRCSFAAAFRVRSAFKCRASS